MEKTKMKDILEWICCIAIAVICAVLIRYYVGTPTIVDGESMYPTLVQDERLLVNRLGRTTKTLPQRGEIITIEEPSKTRYSANEINQSSPIAIYEKKDGLNWFIYNFLEIGKRSYIKRVIALPGEYIEIREGKVYINGEELQEEYLPTNTKTEITSEVGFDNLIVPENCVFVMGDNRAHSADSRNFGCIPIEKIESKLWIRITPFNRFGTV